MPKIRCHYIDCGFLDDGYCSAALVEVDPDNGCLTYAPTAEVPGEDEWDEEEMEEWDDADEEIDEEDDDWEDEEEEF
jgi:hypothetical protein